MKRTPLKRGKSKLKKAKQLVDKSQAYQMHKFFKDFWDALPKEFKKCWSCEKPLYDPVRSYYFDHLVEKSKRPDLAFKLENIFICCLECHALKTDGHPTDPHREAIEKAKEKFGAT
jgi:5-methylcytosine-specific restriction endonuclease McrA